RISLELGGHAPLLVFDDADLDVAVAQAVACKYRNAGQTCVCTNRVYVQRGIAEEFTAAFAAASARLVVGDPTRDETDVGPLVDAQGLAKVAAHVEDAVAKGARVVTGGKGLEGLYFQPTVLADVTPDMLMMREETFGPVAPVVTFDDDAEAVRMANDSPVGLAAYLFTNDVSRAFRVAEALEYGVVGLNDGVPSTPPAPFGGPPRGRSPRPTARSPVGAAARAASRGQPAEETLAGLLALATRRGADAAVRHVAGVLLAFVGAGAARLGAGAQLRVEDRRVP